MNTTHYFRYIFLTVLLVFFAHGAAYAGRGDKTKSIHTPQGGSPVVTGTTTAIDSISLDPLGSNQRDYMVRNRISFGVDMHYPEFVAGPQLVEVSMHVTCWDVNNNPMPALDFKLSIAYYHDDTLHSQILNDYEFNNAYKMVFRIDTIRVDGVISSTLPKNLFVQGDIFVERYTELSSDLVTYIEIQLLDQNCDEHGDELRFSWKELPGAEEYQVEFMHVSNYGANGTILPAGQLDYDFRHNSTRITTSKLFYDIPLIFDRGWVAYRVRGVGIDILDPDHLVYGEWSLGTVAAKIDGLPNDCKIEITDQLAHQKALNWQYSATYAEQGKRKEVISYYDGTLRSRQAVTKVNTEKNVIVGETIYDYQGRPAINVLPVPVSMPKCENSEPVLQYYENFNRNSKDEPYAAKNFDEGKEDCSSTSEPMSSNDGASRYYSRDNQKQSLQQAYLPDAKGYPFQEIEYTPDNTGRISRQGGVGPDFQLGTNKESRFLYGNPNQLELNRLFGSEVGYAKHYQKNAVIDANGQVSVSYIDMTGKVVATALAGEAPQNLERLSAPEPQRTIVNHIYPDGTNQSADYEFDVITYSTSIVVTAPTEIKINYELVTAPMTDSCLAGICVDCVYDLELSLRDECGADLLDTSLQHRMAGNFHDNGDGSYTFHAQCADSTVSPLSATAYLNMGKYTINKKLSLREDAVNAYLALIDSSECVLTYQDFLDAEMQNVDSSICMIDCDNCLEELGSLQDYISTGQGTASEYYAHVQECKELCKDRISDCEMYLTLMELDMSPGGQYAEYQNPSSGTTNLGLPLSVFNTSNLLPHAGANWKNPVLVTPNGTQQIYADENGVRSKIYLTEDPANPGSYLPHPVNSGVVQTEASTGLHFIYPEQLLSVLDFIDNFENSWARSLVKYHPEYCFYESCIQYEEKHAQTDAFSSSSFDNLLFNTNTFAQAQAFGFLTPGGVPSNWFSPTGGNPTDSLKPWDPFVFYASDFETSLCNGYAVDLVTKFYDFKYEFGQWYSMAQMAAYTVRCGSNFPSVPAVDCYNFGQTYNGIMDTSILNNEWRILKALYMSAKQDFQQQLSQCKALTDCDAYNACIGNVNYSPFPVFGHIQTSPTSQYFPFWDHGQPCSVFNSVLYRYKTKRFSMHEDAMKEDANSTSYELYLQTGQCPTAFSLQHLLNELAAGNQLTAASFNLSTTSFLSALFQANNSYYNPGTSPSLTYVSTAGTNTITADWKDGATTFATLTLNKTAPQNWGDVTGIVNLTATGTHTFQAEATYMNIANSTIQVFPVTGSLSYFELDGCTFEQECASSQLALDLTTVFNVLNMDNALPPSAPINLASYSSASMGSSISLISLYIANAANMGNNLSISSPTTDLYRIYDASASGNNGLYIKFTGTSGTLSSAITGYEPMISTGNFSFDMEAQQTYGYPVTLHGVMYQVHNGDTIGLSAGDCGLPTPNKCQGPAFETYEDLQPLLADVLIHYNGSTNINLYGSIYTTPAIVAAFPFGETATTSTDTGDSLIISAGDCDLVFTLNPSLYVQFDNLVGAGNFELTGDLNQQSAYNHFWFIGTFQTPSGVIHDTIYGTTCFSLKDCHPCSDTAVAGISALRQLAVPVGSVEEFNALTASTEDMFLTESYAAVTAPALAPYDTTGCAAAYSQYLACVNVFNQNFTKFQLGAVTQSYFTSHQYCSCVESYCHILDEIVDEHLQFFTDYSVLTRFASFENACSPCPEYASYVDAVQYYNTHTTTFHVQNIISPELFNAYQYCGCVQAYNSLLTAVLTDHLTFANQGHFDLYASMAAACSNSQINAPENPCKQAWSDYMNCSYRLIADNPTPYTLSMVSFEDFNSLELCNCVGAYCSSIDAIQSGLVSFASQTEFDNYLFGKLDCNRTPPCTPAPASGVLPDMPTVQLENDCIALQVNLAVTNAQNAYNLYLDSVHTVKRQKYFDHCIKTQEKLITDYYDKQHHYMLYYYDVAGNLIKTVPPEGVQLLDISSSSDALNLQIDKDRDLNQKTVFTSHRLQTRYEYNSLNQLVAQYTPDTDPMTAFEQTLPNGLNAQLDARKIQMINDALGYLAGNVGTRGYLYKTLDGGKTWTRVHNLLAADLKKIVMLDASNGIAAGEAGTILKTTDGGQSWDLVDTWVTSGMIKNITDIAVLSPTSSPDILVVGDNGLAARCTNFLSSSPTFTITNSGLSGDVKSAEVLSGAFYCTTYDPAANVSRFYRLTSSTWTELTDVMTNNFSDVYSYEDNKAYAADLDGRLYDNKSLASGRWTHHSSNIKDPIYKIRFFDQYQGVSLVEQNGIKTLFRTIDGASNWAQIHSNGYEALSISKDQTLIAAAGANKHLAVIFPYVSGTDQLTEVTPPATAGNFSAVWVEKASNGNVHLIAIDQTKIYYTVNALVASPVWTEFTYSSLGSPIKQLEAELMPGGEVYGVAITAAGTACKLKRNASAPIIETASIFSGTGFTALTKSSQYFYLSYTTSGTGLRISPMNASNTLTTAGTLPFATLSMHLQGQRMVTASGNGDIAFVGLNSGGSISTIVVQTKKVSPDRINRLKTDGPNNKLWAFGNDGLVYHWNSSTGAFVRITNAINEHIYDAYVRSTDVMIAGQNGLAKRGTHSSYTSLTLQDLLTVSGQPVASTLSTTDLHALVLTSVQSLYLAGTNGTLLYSPDGLGTNSMPLNVIGQGGVNLYGICPRAGLDQVLICGANGRMQEQFGSMTLVNQNVFIPGIADIHFRDAASATLIGWNYTSRATTDGGGSWKIIKPQGSASPAASYGKVWTLAGGKSLLFGNGNTLLYTASTGITSTAFTATDVRAVAKGTSNQELYFVDGNAVRKLPLNTLVPTTVHTMSGSNPVNALQVFTNGDHILVGDAGLYKHYTAGGTLLSYSTGLPSTNFTALAFFDNLNGIIVGSNGTYYRSSNATVSTSGYLDATQWDARDLSLTDPLGVPMSDLFTVAIASSTNILIGGKNASPTYPYVRLIYDAGGRYSNRFYYDRLGRIVVSRNSRQEAESKYSYTLYDALGRVYEAGEKVENDSPGEPHFGDIFGSQVSGYFNPSTIEDQKLQAWITAGGARREVTRSYYDEPVITGLPSSVSADVTTQRLRILHTTYEARYDGDDQTYDHATHYKYDIHGNVQTLLQDNQQMAVNFPSLAGERFKRLDYSYDLLSGNVHRMSVQEGKIDQWHHAYTYDGDNRLRKVYTNTHDPLTPITRLTQNKENELVANSDWQNDAQYYYYDHGPLARVEVGQNNLQGVDYYYTLQGPLKGVNSSINEFENDQIRDPGRDSDHEYLNRFFGKDVFGYGLQYYTGDYISISDRKPLADVNPHSHPAYNSFDLYNGNIRYMQTAITNPTDHSNMPMLNAYKYDQLNRLVESRSYEKDLTDVEWKPDSYNDSYYNAFTYDGMGNILTQKRNKRDGQELEGLRYQYEYDDHGNLKRNRLYHINDWLGTTSDVTDIEDMGTFDNNPTTINQNNNYAYDAEGRLIKDVQEEIEQIVWRMDGKVKEIIRTPGSEKKNISFDYNSMGNRIAKHVYNSQTLMLEKSTYYILDGQGKQLSVYEHVADEKEVKFVLAERNIYGSARLGNTHERLEMTKKIPDPSYGWLGNRSYEFSNHLGNVLAVVNDIVYPLSEDNSTVHSYQVSIAQVSDYSPFGVQLDGRTISNSGYRYGFQGQEKDDEIKGPGNSLNYEYRMHDSRIGRFFAVDPLTDKYPYYSPYQFSGNRPIDCVELEGLEPATAANQAEGDIVPAKNKENGEIENWKYSKDPNNSNKFNWSSMGKYTPSMEEAADVANHVYNLKYEEYGPGKGEDYGYIGDWKVQKEYTDLSTGYQAGLYRRNIDGVNFYIFATAGTDDIFDGVADAKTGLGLLDKQVLQSVKDAIRIHKYVSGLEHGNSLTFVGHSLGGGEASANARATGCNAITFNAMGLNRGLKAWLTKTAKIDAYIIRGEVLDTYQRGVGLKAEGTIHYLDAQVKTMTRSEYINQSLSPAKRAFLNWNYANYVIGASAAKHMMSNFIKK